tara:strand:- start:6366 stop:6533 length:168 start_codon:yes stop_codon:yes gene_type:complete
MKWKVVTETKTSYVEADSAQDALAKLWLSPDNIISITVEPKSFIGKTRRFLRGLL